MKRLKPTDVRNAIFMLPEGGVGDLLLSSPIIEALKLTFPGVEVRCWVSPRHRPILYGNPFVDDHLNLTAIPFAQALDAVRGQRFDLAVIPWTTARAAWLAFLGGVRWRVGQAGRMLYSWTFTHPVTVRPRLGDTDSHWVECQLDYARAIGCEPSGLKPVLRLFDHERREAHEMLSAAGVKPGERTCLLHIGRDVPVSIHNWPVGKFVAIGVAISRELGFRIVLTGSERESPVVAEVANRMGDAAVNLSGKTTLRGLAALIGEMNVVVCPDSGPSHIAAALGVPAVSIFAMRCDLPNRWRPYEDAHRVVVVRDLACAKERCIREKCGYYECLTAIDEAEVLRAVAELTSTGVRR